MAANKRAVPKVDYKQLNALSSVVLFDTSAKKVKGRKIYDVERAPKSKICKIFIIFGLLLISEL